MKKYLAVIISLIFGIIFSFAGENSKFTAYSVSVCEGGKWSSWEDCSVLISITDRDDGSSKICIFSAEYQEYDTYNCVYYEQRNDYGFESKFHSVDLNGLKCDVRIAKQNNGSVMYIDYADITIAYLFKDR